MRTFISVALKAMLIGGILVLGGCSSAIKKQQKVIAVGVHKINDSLNKGRIDLAKKYSNELVKVVPKPKAFVPVKPIVVKYPDKLEPETIIVLPPEFKNQKPVVVDTPEFTKIVEENREIKKQIEAEKKEFVKFQKESDEAVRKVWEELQKSQKKTSLWSWFWGLGFAGMIGVVILVMIFPQFLPIILSWSKSVIGTIWSFILSWLKLFTKKKDEAP